MHFLQEITIVATVSVLVTIVLGRLKLPVIAGLVLSGALVGPNGFSIAQDSEAIEVIAEVGVVFLLFTIGLEFSLSKLRHIFRQVALGGLLQVSITAAITTSVSLWVGCSLAESITFGFVFALSSTALVLRTLSEKRTRCSAWSFHCGNAYFSGSMHCSNGANHTPSFSGAR